MCDHRESEHAVILWPHSAYSGVVMHNGRIKTDEAELIHIGLQIDSVTAVGRQLDIKSRHHGAEPNASLTPCLPPP